MAQEDEEEAALASLQRQEKAYEAHPTLTAASSAGCPRRAGMFEWGNANDGVSSPAPCPT